MSKVDFLKAVLPDGTRYSLRLIKKTPTNEDIVHNRLYNNVETLDSDVEDYVNHGWNVYYATAGFGAGNKATAENATAKKEFYIDVDCGLKKPYATKADGLEALKNFCASIGMPRPTLVDSGNGWHAHWILEDAIPVHEWKALAELLKAKCVEQEFKVDGACTADMVRVLRVPETINLKGGNTVTLVTPIKLYTLERIKKAIGEATPDIFAKARELTKSSGSQSEIQKLISSNRTSKFETIWLRSINGDGCAQIKYAIENADSLPEPLWRAGLSEAQFCVDRDWAIHKLSEGHPNYDPEQTEAKAAATKGPYTCESYQGLDRPDLCNGCQHKGKIKSPIQLGSEILQATEEDNVVEVVKDDRKITYDIPPYPFPFFRGKHGGIYVNEKVENEEGGKDTKQTVVYPYDLYAFMRQRHHEAGDVVWLRCHLPNDGVREFMLPQYDIGSKDRLRDGISKEGVTIFSAKQLQNFQTFLGKQIEELQLREKAEEMNTRFGWTRDNTFIIGDREYTNKGVINAPVAKALGDYVQWFKLAGTIDVWKAVAEYYNDEMFDMHAFGVLAGFGSVLMQISPEHGGVVNYYSKDSGTGKTTILKMANSIFGHPKSLLKDARDTQLSKVHRMGVLNGIVSTVDEMTNIHPDEASNLLYGSTQGRARDRMMASTNAERSNQTTWKLISLWSSNTSVEDKLSILKVDPQGEMARVLELHLQTPVPGSVLESQKVFNQLESNYGHAGDIFMRYVIPNMDEVRIIWNGVRDKIYAIREWSQMERYRLNIVICAISAGIIAKKLDLVNYNIGRITKKVLDALAQGTEEMRAGAVKAVETFAMYVNRNVNSMLIINAGMRAGVLGEVPIKTPSRGSLSIRYEPDTGSLFVVQRDFNKWCAEMYINAKEMRTLFKKETGQTLDLIKKRMGKGWDTDFGPVLVYEIKDARTVLGIDIEPKNVAPAATA